MRGFDYGDGISAIDARYGGREKRVAVHLIVEGAQAAIVDTAHNAAAPAVLAALAERGVAPEAVALIVLTHVHLDHAGAAGTLMRACPNARLTVHPRGARHMIDPGALVAGTRAVYGAEAAQAMYGEIVPVAADRVVETGEGATIAFAGRELRFFDAPGHARHHVCVRDMRTGHLFAGDNFGLSYRETDRDGLAFVFPTTTPVQFEPGALHATIDRILALAPGAIYLAHFGQVRDVERIGADLHRLVDEHVRVARACPHAEGAPRQQWLRSGLFEVLLDEAARQRWSGERKSWLALFGDDVQLNAAGLGAWIDRGMPEG
ncbi:MAG: MBL fold metallo-hydrolase [Burkholderiaceae bacterium]|nr:MBL fold metallo-hydrolase [Burkholderiaceae bacterium]